MARVAIITQHHYAYAGGVGRWALELATHIDDALPDHDVVIVTSRAAYHGAYQPPTVEKGVSTKVVAGLAIRRPYPLRLLASMFLGARLAELGTRDADVVIALTDPPLLPLWVGIAARLRGRPWVEWMLDVHPDIFVGAGLVSQQNGIYRLLRAVLHRFQPQGRIALGVAQGKYLDNTRGARETIVLPCGVVDPVIEAEPEWLDEAAGRTTIAYAGNLGEAASVEALVALVERANPERFALVLAPQGRNAAAFRKRFQDHPAIIWRDTLRHAELAHADVHFVSLRTSMTHLCVPSKAVTAISLGRPIIFAGSAESDTWQMFADCGWHLPEREPTVFRASDLDEILRQVEIPAEVERRAQRAAVLGDGLRQSRDDALGAISSWVLAHSEAAP